MSSESQEGQISKDDSQFSVDLKTNKIKKKSKKKRVKKNPKIISSTYKKQKCLHYNKGNCTKGQTCTFSHDFEPQSSKIICKYFISNACTKGPACNFSHNTQEYPCRFFHLQNRCNQRIECRFSHLPVNEKYMNDFIKENKDMIVILWREQKLGMISDENLRKEIITFINKEIIPQQEPKKKGFKGQLKLLVQNSLQLAEQAIKPKPIDPRLKMKSLKPVKIQQSQKIDGNGCIRDWITQVPQISHSEIKLAERVINVKLIQKFLYSYY